LTAEEKFFHPKIINTYIFYIFRPYRQTTKAKVVCPTMQTQHPNQENKLH